MKATFNIPIVFFLIVFLSCGVEKKATKRFERGQFQTTIDLYEQVLKKDPNNAEANFYVAESYRQSNRLQEAENYYAKAIDRGLSNDSIRLFYAFSLKSNGKYGQAREEIEEYLETVEDEQLKKRAEEAQRNLEQLDVVMAKKNFFRVKNLDDINSPAAEYAPVYNDGELYFTTSRGESKIYLATGTPFTNIYKVKTQGAIIDTTSFTELDERINNYNINEGSVTFSPDGQTMVFARGNSGKKKGTADVNLYLSSNRRDGWTEPRLLNINNPGYWDSSPAFSRDGKTLYFASNRPGGYGGTDIYSARRNSRGRYFNVTNLGPDINTTGNEMFPYISAEGYMYFASDGHPGFGGLDLFVAKRRNGRTNIENLGEPMNSRADDFGLYLFKADRGFFTSNRDGGEGDDDIYTFVNEDPDLKIINYYLEGVTMTYDEKDQQVVLPGVEVRLLDHEGKLLDQTVTESDGKFLFRIYEQENYNLIGEKTGGTDQYLNTRIRYTTVGRSVNRDTLKQLVTDVKFDTLLVLEKIEKNKIFVLENIYYDLDKAEIRDDAALELNKLVTILEDNPELKIELSSHTDTRAPDEYNMDLSQRRARSAVNYLISQGIAPNRLIAKGYGETKLIIPEAQTEEEHQVNRRTEFKILEVGERRKSTTDEFDEDRFFDDEDGLSEDEQGGTN